MEGEQLEEKKGKDDLITWCSLLITLPHVKKIAALMDHSLAEDIEVCFVMYSFFKGHIEVVKPEKEMIKFGF